MCSLNNEAELKALFKIHADQLRGTFNKAIIEKWPEETVCGSESTLVHAVKSFKQAGRNCSYSSDDKTTRKCNRYGKDSHLAPDCRFKTVTCNYCKIQGHLESICCKKNLVQKCSTSKGTGKIQSIETCAISNTSDNFCRVSCLQVLVYIHSTCRLCMKLGTATGGNFISEEIWKAMGEPDLQATTLQYQSASKHLLPIPECWWLNLD